MIANTHTNTNNGVLQNIRSTSSRAKNEFLKSKPKCSRKHNRQRIQANNRRPMWRILRIFVERSDRPPTAPPPRHLHIHLNSRPIQIALAPDLSTPYLNDMQNNPVTKIYNNNHGTPSPPTNDSTHDFLRNVWSKDHDNVRVTPGHQTYYLSVQ